jgi:hypothetical protein
MASENLLRVCGEPGAASARENFFAGNSNCFLWVLAMPFASECVIVFFRE